MFSGGLLQALREATPRVSQWSGISDIYTLTRDHIIRMHRAVPLSCPAWKTQCRGCSASWPSRAAARTRASIPAILAVFFGPLVARVVIETAPGRTPIA